MYYPVYVNQPSLPYLYSSAIEYFLLDKLCIGIIKYNGELKPKPIFIDTYNDNACYTDLSTEHFVYALTYMQENMQVVRIDLNADSYRLCFAFKNKEHYLLFKLKKTNTNIFNCIETVW